MYFIKCKQFYIKMQKDNWKVTYNKEIQLYTGVSGFYGWKLKTTWFCSPSLDVVPLKWVSSYKTCLGLTDLFICVLFSCEVCLCRQRMWDSHSVSVGCTLGLRRPSSLTSYEFPSWAETILSPLDTRPPHRAMLATTPL